MYIPAAKEEMRSIDGVKGVVQCLLENAEDNASADEEIRRSAMVVISLLALNRM